MAKKNVKKVVKRIVVLQFFINGAMCYKIRDAVAKIVGSSRGILEYSEEKKKLDRNSFRNLDGCELLMFSKLMIMY